MVTNSPERTGALVDLNPLDALTEKFRDSRDLVLNSREFREGLHADKDGWVSLDLDGYSARIRKDRSPDALSFEFAPRKGFKSVVSFDEQGHVSELSTYTSEGGLVKARRDSIVSFIIPKVKYVGRVSRSRIGMNVDKMSSLDAGYKDALTRQIENSGILKVPV